MPSSPLPSAARRLMYKSLLMAVAKIPPHRIHTLLTLLLLHTTSQLQHSNHTKTKPTACTDPRTDAIAKE